MAIDLRTLLLAAVTLCGCQSTTLSKVDGGSKQLGNFVEVPSGWQALYIDQHGGEIFYGSGDVPDKIQACRDDRYEICFHSTNKDLAFIVPKDDIRVGDKWSEFGFSFSVAKIVIDTAYIDVQLPNRPDDLMRFFYRNGRVFGFSYGNKEDRPNCAACFDARITYVWTGDEYFPPNRQSTVP